MTRIRHTVAAGLAVAAIVAATAAAGPIGAAAPKNDKTLDIILVAETTGESAQAIPNFADAAEMAIADLEKQGWTVNYERIPASGVQAASQEAAFNDVLTKNPDFWIGLTSSNVFIPVGPKVAATDQPTFALASPSEGIRTGPSGGDNIFLLRPLNEQTAANLIQYVCEEGKAKKIGISAVNTSFGTLSDRVAREEIKKYKGCKIVTTQTNAFDATDLTQQVLAFRDADVDAIVAFNFPIPMGALVNQLAQNGVDVPFYGGASLGLAVDSGSITNLENLVVIDDCAPAVEKDAQGPKFNKRYKKQFGYAPNYASAQAYDAFFMAANAVTKAGHDHAALNKAMLETKYDGICNYNNDKNNVLSQSTILYEYGSTPDTKKFLKQYEIPFIPPEELLVTTTTTTTPSA